jgi:type I restriction enzyme R subunit
VKTLEALRADTGTDEGKVFNLVRGLHHELEEEPAAAPILQPLKDRAERILEALEQRKTTGLAAMDELAALAAEKDAAAKAARDSGLTAKGFGVFWALRREAALTSAGIDPMGVAREADASMTRFPNAAVNADEQRRLRANMYRPLLKLGKDDRVRVVELIVATLLR